MRLKTHHLEIFRAVISETCTTYNVECSSRIIAMYLHHIFRIVHRIIPKCLVQK